MKILAKDKIVEAFRFPISEALVFSILVWSAWGLAEAFYWTVVAQWIDPEAPHVEALIYLEAFLIYLSIAAAAAVFVYCFTKIIMAIFHSYDTYVFRGVTLAAILGLFFLITMHFCYYNYLDAGHLGKGPRMGIAIAIMLLATFLTWLLYRWGSSVGFRIRRSGTMMLSIAVLSVVLSFVSFPIFSSEFNSKNNVHQQKGYRKLMAYHYFKPLLTPER
jgi:hypothetical protein